MENFDPFGLGVGGVHVVSCPARLSMLLIFEKWPASCGVLQSKSMTKYFNLGFLKLVTTYIKKIQLVFVCGIGF